MSIGPDVLDGLKPSGEWLRGACPWCGSGSGFAVSRTTGFKHCFACQRRQAGDRRVERGPDPRQLASKVERAEWLWNRAGLLTPETAPGRYLLGRYIEPPWSPELRALPRSGDFWPALVAAVRGVDGRLTGVQVVRVTGGGRKAPCEPVRTLHGRILGRAVRLDAATSRMAVTESVEDGLALRVLRRASVLACPGTGFVAKLELPPVVRELVIVPDRDDPGAGGADRLAARARRAGVRVRIVWPTHKDVCEDLAAVVEGAR